MNTHLNVARAVFQADGKPDTEVRVLPDPTGGVSFSINFGGTDVLNSGFIPPERELQLAESLQFVADTIGARVPGRLTPFTRGWISTAADVHQTAKEKGFWPPDTEDYDQVNDAEKLCLIHSEISEALEALRYRNPPDDKMPEFTGVEVELADAVIRIMDLAHARGWRVAQAIEAKMKFNASRTYKHGKEF
jgi:NTP pyrophosphatase (non-canonical NTP hydrolase)